MVKKVYKVQERKYRLSIWGGIYKKLGVYAAIDRLIENGYYAMEYPDIFTSEYLNLPREEYLAEAEKIRIVPIDELTETKTEKQAAADILPVVQTKAVFLCQQLPDRRQLWRHCQLFVD